MSSKEQNPRDAKTSSTRKVLKSATQNLERVAQPQPHQALTIQRAKLDPSSLTAGEVRYLQRALGNQAVGRLLAQKTQPPQFQTTSAPGENRTGMPDQLKAGLEQLSGLDLSGVQVHDNSAKPAHLNALAYTQGQDIEVGPGQERHLPHEGWHVVQQMQGRVQPTLQAKGVSINNDAALEREADMMGAKALQMTRSDQVAEQRSATSRTTVSLQTAGPVIQRTSIEQKLQEYIVGQRAVDGDVDPQLVADYAHHLLQIMQAITARQFDAAYDLLMDRGIAVNLGMSLNSSSKTIDPTNKTEQQIDAEIDAIVKMRSMFMSNSKTINTVEVSIGNPITGRNIYNDESLAMKVLPVMLEEWIHGFQHTINTLISDQTMAFMQTPTFIQNQQDPNTPNWNANEIDIYAIYRELGWNEVLDTFRARYPERQAFERFINPPQWQQIVMPVQQGGQRNLLGGHRARLRLGQHRR